MRLGGRIPPKDVFQQRPPLYTEDASLQETIMTSAVQVTIEHPVRLSSTHEALGFHLAWREGSIDEPILGRGSANHPLVPA